MSDLTNLMSYIEGPYAPVPDETAADDLEVIGQIPRELRGSFVQNNPNPRFQPRGLYHWFDGDGMVHGVHLADGRASYRNRWIRTAGLAADEAAGEALTRGILEPFEPGDPHPDKDTANTDLIVHSGKLLALWWLGGQPMHLSNPGLETVGPEDFNGTLRCGVAAHPKVDPRTGELIFFDYSVYRRPYLRYGVADAEGRVVHQVDVDIPEPSLFHDIAITENYTVLMDLPMTWDAAKIAQGKRRVRFHRDRPARFGIVPRRGASVRWFEAPACYSYHTVNAWEEVNERGEACVVLLGCRIEDPIPRLPHDREPTIPRLYFLRLHPFYHRWRFNLDTGAVTEEPLDDAPTEFPRMNDERLGLKTRYSYHPRIAPQPTLMFDGCIKYDLEGATQAHTWGEHCVGGETVFAPRPGGTDEDDGWVMTYVSDRREGTSELVILDARDVSAGPVARVKVPRRVPIGFHAQWAPLA